MKVLAQRNLFSQARYGIADKDVLGWFPRSLFRARVWQPPFYRPQVTVNHPAKSIVLPTEYKPQEVSYSDVLKDLSVCNANEEQVDIWRDTFNWLEQNKLPTLEFSKGFIELLKADATDIELKSYAIGSERVVGDSRRKTSINNVVAKVLEIVKRDDLSPSSRARLINNEFTNIERSNDRFSRLKEAGKFLLSLATDILFRFIKPV